MPKQTVTDPTLTAACEVAREVVRKQFPELAEVEPEISQRQDGYLHDADQRRLGVVHTARKAPASTQYTFTFSREIRTPEGYSAPRVARVTVDGQHHVVKAILSK